LLTWQKLHQQPKYLEDLQLPLTAFEGLKVLDVGSGPHPSALVFSNCEIYNFDPLLPLYIEAGYPIHIYDDRVKFVYGFSEKMPFADDFFDAVISANALDHVDDFRLTANEIKRVLKPSGKLRLHLHFHPATSMEPLEINDSIVSKAFDWCEAFKKISESKAKRGTTLDGPNESFSVWSNF
jgi:SAM-dependent methyltransferase